MKSSVVIIDTECANLSSVKFAVERLGYKAVVSDNRETILSAEHVILPGVGSAQHAMANIRVKQLDSLIKELTQPVLGFCLGMQLMTNSSEESGMLGEKTNVSCLGVIPTEIVPLDTKGLIKPHMGWNKLKLLKEHQIFHNVPNESYVYFVHSYGAPVSEYTIASCDYGSDFSAAISYNNFVGCQFHPERSSDVGSQIIRNFLEIKG